MGRREELGAAGRLTADALSGLVEVVGDVHRAVDARVERALPAPAAPVVATQRAITSAVYRGVSAGQKALSWVGATAVEMSGAPDDPPLSSTRWGQVAIPVLNGLWGDHLAQRHHDLAVTMAIRVAGTDVPCDPDAIARAFPEATGSLVLFIHGLSESDRTWHLRLHDEPGEDSLPYGERMRADLQLTPVYLRYNTGLRVAENGRLLSQLLEDLVAAWPVPVERVFLVGHSMGGLVARSACHIGGQMGARWVPCVTVVATLGTPHLGAPLEQAVHVAEWTMRRFPESAPIARVLGRRSLGVQDLRFGSLLEEDWHGQDPDEFLRDRCRDVPFLPHATYCYVAASLTRDPDHPWGHWVGDGLVRYPSASGVGRTRRMPLTMDDGVHIGGLHHLDLLHHPVVYEHLREWFTAAG
jgi:pimeloyl-ACP methyl ester carboxylesterase